MISYSFVFLRTPLQSISKAYDCVENIGLNSIFEQGLYLSSPELWKEYRKESNEKIRFSILKYWIRNCSRCTPYGTFAGIGVLDLSDQDEANININSMLTKLDVRLDMNFLYNMIESLTQVPIIFKQIKFFPNNSIFIFNESIRFVEYEMKNSYRQYFLSSISKTEYIISILERAQNGATLNDLVKALTEITDVDQCDAENFIKDLYNSQLLISELSPNITGCNPLERIIKILEPLNKIEHYQKVIKDIHELLRSPEKNIDYLLSIEAKLKNIPLSINIPKNIVQVDSYISIKNSINKKIIDKIASQSSELLIFACPQKNGNLDIFKKNFFAKYELKKVPFNIALDPDLGIGYGNKNTTSSEAGKIIDDITIGVSSNSSSFEFDSLLQFCLNKYKNFLQSSEKEIEIYEEEIKSMKNPIHYQNFSDGFVLKGALLSKDRGLNLKDFSFVIDNFGTGSSANMLTRFAQGNPKIHQCIQKLIEEEEKRYDSEDIIFAEITHLPQTRLGNILLRPVFRNYEIPYVGNSGIEFDKQIPLEDLIISVRNDEIILESKELKKRIIPRQTTAHNFYKNTNLPIYKFLCDLQNQGCLMPRLWNWGPYESSKYLPRVVYKNLVICKARWQLNKKDLPLLPSNEEDYFAVFDKFCKELNIPFKVNLLEGDNTLLIDFTQLMGIKIFLSYLRRGECIIEEFLLDPSNCIVKDQTGAPYTNEIIIPLLNTTKDNQFQHTLPTQKEIISSFDIKRKYLPYSEWLYFKIYCSIRNADKILLNFIYPFIIKKNPSFEKFFFLRYHDDFPHLRIRFYNHDINKQNLLIEEFVKLLSPLVNSNIVDKIIVDTYERELERYGSSNIVDAEDFFFSDSVLCLNIIKLALHNDEKLLFFCLKSIDLFLSDLQMDIERKIEIVNAMRQSFFGEFGGQKKLQKDLNDKYRKYQKDIFYILMTKNSILSKEDLENKAFEIRSKLNSNIVSRHIISAVKLNYSNSFLFGQIHMIVNRIFPSQQRKYELIIYHFLERYYRSNLVLKEKKMNNSHSKQ